MVVVMMVVGVIAVVMVIVRVVAMVVISCGWNHVADCDYGDDAHCCSDLP